MQYVQEFYQTVRDKCYKVCVTSPGSSLSGSEQKCLGRCMDRYQDVSAVVSCLSWGAAAADDDARRRRSPDPIDSLARGTPRARSPHASRSLSRSLAANRNKNKTTQATNVVTKAVLSQQGMN